MMEPISKPNSKYLTREEIYKMVWSTPIKAIVLEHNISTYNLKKICKDNNIPLPKAGYWSKRRYEKKVLIVPMPKIEKSNHLIDIDLYQLDKLTTLKREIEKELKSFLKVPEKLTRPCDLIKNAKKDLKTKKTNYYSDMKGFVGTTNDVFSILVSKSLVNRSLLFSDTLIKLIRKRGHQVKIIKNERYFYNNGIRIVVNDEPYKFCVRETRKRIMTKGKYWDTAEYFPSGILTFRIEEFHKHEWKDTAKVALENKLSHILAYLEIRSRREIRERNKRNLRHLENERIQEIEYQFKQKRIDELNCFKQLLSNSKRWHKAMELKNYISFIEANAINNNSLSKSLKEWLIWASKKADWYDPLIEKEDELLVGVNKDLLGS